MTDESHQIPDDMAANYSRLINAAEDMRQAATDELKQVYADLRDELKSLGWTGSSVSFEVAALKGAISEMRLEEKDRTKREVRGERIDDYVSLLTRARARESRPKSYSEAKGREQNTPSDAAPRLDTTVIAPDSAGEVDTRDLPTNSNSQSAADAATSTDVDVRDVQGGIPVGANASLSGVTGGESAATISPERAPEDTAPHGDADNASAESVSPQTGSIAANAGGDHVNASDPAPEGAALVSISAPHKPLRPHCLRPGKPDCAGYGDKTCHACLVAARNTGEAA